MTYVQNLASQPLSASALEAFNIMNPNHGNAMFGGAAAQMMLNNDSIPPLPHTQSFQLSSGNGAQSHKSHHSAPPVGGVETELNSIRRELQDINRDVRRDLEANTLQANLSSEIDSLYDELQKTAKKLEAERTLRRKIEAALETVREDRIRQTNAVVQELQAKRDEIAVMSAERAELKGWLDRAVTECTKIADEVLRLRKDLEASEKNCAALEEEKIALAEKIENLSKQLSRTQEEMEHIHHEKHLLEARLKETQDAINLAEVTKKNLMGEVKRLESEVYRLQGRVKGTSDADHSLGLLCGTIRVLCGEITDLDVAIKRGTLSERFDKPLVFLSPRPEPHAGTSDVVAESKILGGQLLNTIRSLDNSVRTFMQERQKERIVAQRQHQDELAALHKEREKELIKYNIERAALEKREEDLERELLAVAAGTHENISVEATKRLEELEVLISTNRALSAENTALKREIEELSLRSRKMKIDWSKVDESRQRLQQLQMELAMMNEYNEKLAKENRNLKFLFESTPNAAAAGGAIPAAAGQRSPMSTKKQPTAVLEKEAFEEWKRRAIRSAAESFNNLTD